MTDSPPPASRPAGPFSAPLQRAADPSSGSFVNRVELVLPAETLSVGLARDTVADTLVRWSADEYHWCALQIVSELTTNALLHARSAFHVIVEQGPGGVRIGVADSSPVLPRPRTAAMGDTTGRGLAVVERCSVDWYVEHGPDGKVIWAVCLTDEQALLRSLDGDHRAGQLPQQPDRPS